MQGSAFPLIAIEGPARDRGRQYGRLAGDRIAVSVGIYLDGQNGPDRDVALDRARAYIPIIGRAFPDFLEEIQGIAEGSDRSVEEILLLNARTEILFQPPADEGCTSAAVLPPATDGRVLAAQNWDWNAACRDCAIILNIRPDRGPSIITYVEAGMLGRSGLNSAGIGLCGNYLGCDQPRAAAGIPIPLIRRAILQSETLVEAVGYVVRAPRAASSNHLLAHRDGEAIDLEMTPQDSFPIYPNDGVLVHANHFVSPGAAARIRDTGIKMFPDSLFRDRALRQRLSQCGRPLGPDDLKTALTDHSNYPASVCRHKPRPYSNDERQEEIVTAASIVMDVSGGRLWVAPGQPCSTPYHEYSLGH